MNILRACLDWRVLTGLAALGVGIFLVAPGIAAAALPLLIVAVCPLSMMLMMRSMGGDQKSAAGAAPAADGDRVVAVRRELAQLSGRQQKLASELAAVESAQAAASQPAPETPAEQAR